MKEADTLGQVEALMFSVGVIGIPMAALIVALTASVWVGLLILVVGIVLLIVVALMRPTMYRLVRFLFLLGGVPNVQPAGGLRVSGCGTVLHEGADRNDPKALRVVIEDASGKVHISEVLPPGGDLKAAWHQTIDGLQVPVREVRAEQGDDVIHRWKPSWRGRMAVAFAVAFRR